MADDTTRITTGRLKSFDRAVRGKWNKYSGSGIAILVAGVIVLLIKMALVQLSYPFNMLLVGLGVLLIIIGVIRLLIGLINPATPLDIVPVEEIEQLDPPPAQESLHQSIFRAPHPQDE